MTEPRQERQDAPGDRGPETAGPGDVSWRGRRTGAGECRDRARRRKAQQSPPSAGSARDAPPGGPRQGSRATSTRRARSSGLGPAAVRSAGRPAAPPQLSCRRPGAGRAAFSGDFSSLGRPRRASRREEPLGHAEQTVAEAQETQGHQGPGDDERGPHRGAERGLGAPEPERERQDHEPERHSGARRADAPPEHPLVDRRRRGQGGRRKGRGEERIPPARPGLRGQGPTGEVRPGRGEGGRRRRRRHARRARGRWRHGGQTVSQQPVVLGLRDFLLARVWRVRSICASFMSHALTPLWVKRQQIRSECTFPAGLWRAPGSSRFSRLFPGIFGRCKHARPQRLVDLEPDAPDLDGHAALAQDLIEQRVPAVEVARQERQAGVRPGQRRGPRRSAGRRESGR